MTAPRRWIGFLAAVGFAAIGWMACSSSSPPAGPTGSGGAAGGAATGGAGGGACPGASASVTCTPDLAWYATASGSGPQPLSPDPTSGAFCTSGVAPQVSNGQDGGPGSQGDGLIVDFNASGSGGGTKGIWDAHAYGGVAFDFSGTMVPARGLRVSFVFAGQGPDGPPSYQGTAQPYSTLNAGSHVVIHWDAVGGPYGASNPVLFDPSKLQNMQVSVLGSASAPTPYQFCLANLVALPD